MFIRDQLDGIDDLADCDDDAVSSNAVELWTEVLELLTPEDENDAGNVAGRPGEWPSFDQPPVSVAVQE